MSEGFISGDKVKFVPVPDDGSGHEKHPQFKQYLGKDGMVAYVDSVPFGPMVNGDAELRPHYIYKVVVGGREVDAVPDECLVSAE